MTLNELEMMSEMDFADVENSEIALLDSGKMNFSKPPEERVLDLLKSGKNPYFRRSGNSIVKISFSNNGKSFSDALAHAISGI